MSLAEKLALFDGHYSPKIGGCLNADEEAHVLLIEPKRTVNTGDAGGAVTAEESQI